MSAKVTPETITARSKFRVFRDRTQVSGHTEEREALAAAIAEKMANPNAQVHYDHDLQVDVELNETDDS